MANTYYYVLLYQGRQTCWQGRALNNWLSIVREEDEIGRSHIGREEGSKQMVWILKIRYRLRLSLNQAQSAQ